MREKLSIYSSSIMVVQRTLEIIKITSRSVDHLATTTSTEASRRRAAVIAPPSTEPGKHCCSRQSGSRRAKAPWNQRTRTATAADEECRSKGSNLKTHERRRTTNRSEQIHQRQIRRRHTSTRPPMMLHTSPERGLDGETFIPSSGSRRRLAFLNRT